MNEHLKVIYRAGILYNS